MRELDAHEKKIVKELIRNPRISDNGIGRRTKIPVMTVNRKRKQLETEGLLRYFTSFDTGIDGTGGFNAKQLYILKFKIGVTREDFLTSIEYDNKFMEFRSSYISLSYLGEKSGCLALLIIMDARSDAELVDEFNGKFIPYVKSKLGADAIEEVIVAKITHTLRRHHNYLPYKNMEKGIMKDDWPDDWIFVDQALDSNQKS